MIGVDDDYEASRIATYDHRGTTRGRRCKHHVDEAIQGFRNQHKERAASRKAALRERTKFDPPEIGVGCPGTKAVSGDRYPFTVLSVSPDRLEINISGCDEPLTWRTYSNCYVEKSKTIAYAVSCRVGYSFGSSVSYLNPHF